MGARGLSKLSHGRAIRRASPLFLILILVLAIPLAHASTFIGYTAANLGASTCGTNCTSPFTNTEGLGSILKSPLTGQIFQVNIFTGSSVPNRVVVATFPAGSNPTTGTQACAGGGTCAFANTGQVFTIQDNEVLSGLTTNSYSTITLANPISVTVNQWVAVTFMGTAAASFLMFCGTSCGSLGGNAINGVTIDVELQYSTSNPSGTGTTTLGDVGPGQMVGGAFQAQVTSSSGTTQCYGNCGSPPITLVNTNSTHSINFNQSITLFYAFKSNLNGFVQNMTVSVAKDYTNSPEGFRMALYLVDPSCPIGQTPFTPQCPGFSQGLGIASSPNKRQVSILLASVAVTNGQWIGVGISGFFKGLDLNDTNTGVPLFQTNGQAPSQISQSSSFSASSLIGMWVWIDGNVITNIPGTGSFGGGCGSPVCGLNSLVIALGGGVFGGIVAFGLIFGTIVGISLFATRQHDAQGHIKGYAFPSWLLGIVAILLLLGMSAAGALPGYVTLIIILFVAYLFASSIWSHRREQGGTGASM